ncbi:hypothetical protein B0T21DRAFT_363342 [Apiosordaria backusii]|uniref:Uncharacterized protein n=1 Tax=Apiosordaria backusii TaxID=314023 RepID=A0AA40BSW4_9PEZI|nr:hypothetical protein B0T21DRAFT_363342 [Apiosordaria backusii]
MRVFVGYYFWTGTHNLNTRTEREREGHMQDRKLTSPQKPCIPHHHPKLDVSTLQNSHVHHLNHHYQKPTAGWRSSGKKNLDDSSALSRPTQTNLTELTNRTNQQQHNPPPSGATEPPPNLSESELKI